jgi:hypothetical protein
MTSPNHDNAEEWFFAACRGWQERRNHATLGTRSTGTASARQAEVQRRVASRSLAVRTVTWPH